MKDIEDFEQKNLGHSLNRNTFVKQRKNPKIMIDTESD